MDEIRYHNHYICIMTCTLIEIGASLISFWYTILHVHNSCMTELEHGKFGSIHFHSFNSVMHELWTLNCLSNARREAYPSIQLLLIKQIYDDDSKKIHLIPVLFYVGNTVWQWMQGRYQLSYNKVCGYPYPNILV